MINVIKKGEGQGEYIGRGSPLGNDFSHLDNSKAAVKVATRQESIECFAEFIDAILGRGEVKRASVAGFWNQLEANGKLEAKRKEMRAELNRLYGLAQLGDVNLVCYCNPLPCHGHRVKALLEEARQAKAQKGVE